jgi:CDGSH-type Zn-finger protein
VPPSANRVLPPGKGQRTLPDLTGVGETRITPYRNGPYLVRGAFVITDQDGNEIEAGRRVIALCRCGRSKTRPFCDGTHKTIRFRAESGPAQLP